MRRRGAIVGAIAGAILLFAMINGSAGPFGEALVWAFILLMALASLFLPEGPAGGGGPMILPRFSPGSATAAYLLFVLVVAAIGWIAASIWSRFRR